LIPSNLRRPLEEDEEDEEEEDEEDEEEEEKRKNKPNQHYYEWQSSVAF